MTTEIKLNKSEILKEAQRLSKLDFAPTFANCLKVAIKKLTRIEEDKNEIEYQKIRKDFDEIIVDIFEASIKLESAKGCYGDAWKRIFAEKSLELAFDSLFSFALDKEKFEMFALGDTGSVYCFGYDEFHNDKDSVKGYLISRARYYDRYK